MTDGLTDASLFTYDAVLRGLNAQDWKKREATLCVRHWLPCESCKTGGGYERCDYYEDGSEPQCGGY